MPEDPGIIRTPSELFGSDDLVVDDDTDDTIDTTGGGRAAPDATEQLDADPGDPLPERLGHLDLELETAPGLPAPDPGPSLDLNFGSGASGSAFVDASRALEPDASPTSSFDGSEQPFDQPYEVLGGGGFEATEVQIGPLEEGPTEVPITGDGSSAGETVDVDDLE